MNKQTQAAPEEQANTRDGVLYMAIEMGEKSWKLGFTTGEPKDNGQLKVHDKVIEGNDYVALSEAIGKAKERFKLDAGCQGQ